MLYSVCYNLFYYINKSLTVFIAYLLKYVLASFEKITKKRFFCLLNKLKKYNFMSSYQVPDQRDYM